MSTRPSFFSELFTFRGRTNRARYWLTLLIFALLSAIGGGCLIALRMLGQSGAGISAAMPLALIGVALGVYLLGAVISILNAIRRLHDRDRSGHWLWLFYFLPSAFNAAAQYAMPPGLVNPQQMSPGLLAAIGLGALAVIILMVWAIVELGFLRGTRGPNRFGPDPLQP